MNVLCVNGSKRKDGNSATVGKIATNYLSGFKIEAEMITLADYDFEGCNGCEGCATSNQCVVKDEMQQVYQKVEAADALILVSPTYYYNITSDMKKFIERLYCYQIFDKNDRSIWTSVNNETKRKKAVVFTICEQEDEEAAGFSIPAMKKPLEDLGYDVLKTKIFTNAFRPDEIHNSSTNQLSIMKCLDPLLKYKS